MADGEGRVFSMSLMDTVQLLRRAERKEGGRKKEINVHTQHRSTAFCQTCLYIYFWQYMRDKRVIEAG